MSASKIQLSATILCAGLTVSAVSQSAFADEPVLLDELIVTSTGNASPRSAHAGNISRIGQQDIQLVAPDHPSEVLNRIPGVQVQHGSGQEHLTAIRSPVLTGGAGAGSFLYLEDGVPFRAPGFSNVNGLFDSIIETAGAVEVVRGPASARFGSNAVHGLINVLSAAPTVTPETSLSTSIGPHGSYNFTGTTSGGEGNHSARFNLVLDEDSGFRTDSGFGQQKAQLRYDYRGDRDYVRATFAAQNLNQETAGFVEGNDAYANEALRTTNPNPEAFRDAWSTRLAVRWERDLDNGNTLAITPYARLNEMDFLQHFLPGDPLEQNGHWSTGVQTAYMMELGGGHQLILGTDVEYTQGFLKETQAGPTVFGVFVQGQHYDYDVEAVVAAPYIHSVWALSEDTTLTAGARFEYTRYDYTNNAPNNTVGRFQRTPDRVDDFFDVTPKLGITHAFTDGFVGFANLARGARAPQTTDLYRLQSAQIPGQVESEETDSIEIGSRGTTHGISYELASFYMEKSNFFFRDSAGLNVPNGETVHYGVELEASAPLGAGFDLSGSATYAVHKYDFDRAAANPANIITSGDDIDTAPRTLANLRLGYTFDDDRARVELEWVHVGDYAMDAGHTATYEGHDLLNLRAQIAITEQIGLFGRITNLANTQYADRADIRTIGAVTAIERFFPGEDRAVHVGASLRF